MARRVIFMGMAMASMLMPLGMCELSSSLDRELKDKISLSRKERKSSGNPFDAFDDDDGDGNILDFISNIAQNIKDHGKKRGTMTTRGRELAYETHERFHNLEDGVVYDCKVSDITSGVTREVRHRKTKRQAVDDAVDELFTDLDRKGFLVPDQADPEKTAPGSDTTDTDLTTDSHTDTTPPVDEASGLPLDGGFDHVTGSEHNGQSGAAGKTDDAKTETIQDDTSRDQTEKSPAPDVLTKLPDVTASFVCGLAVCVMAILISRRLLSPKTSGSVTQITKRWQAADIEPDGRGLYIQRHIRAANPTSQQHDPIRNYTSLYRSREKGVAYILNNNLFFKRDPEDTSRYRKGSEIDLLNIRHVFTELGYELETHQDLKADDIHQTLDNLVENINREGSERHSSVALFFMSHGSQQGILGTDENVVSLEDVMKKFSGKRCRALIDKPKLIFVQACRGTNLQEAAFDCLDTTVLQHRSINDKPGDGTRDEVDIETDTGFFKSDTRIDPTGPLDLDGIPDNTDIYVAYATSDGYFSIRDKVTGTWFVQAVCEEFLAGAHLDDLDTMMESVSRRVTALQGEVRTRSGDVIKMLQTPDIRKQGVRRKIFFAPRYPPP